MCTQQLFHVRKHESHPAEEIEVTVEVDAIVDGHVRPSKLHDAPEEPCGCVVVEAKTDVCVTSVDHSHATKPVGFTAYAESKVSQRHSGPERCIHSVHTYP